MPSATLAIRLYSWEDARGEALPIRELVFVREQGVPLELEMDEWDAPSDHAIAYAADSRAVGTGRLLPDGHIGRMAVLKNWRGQGVGAALLLALMDLARKRGHASARLNAQTSAAGFYRRYGFEAVGSEFMDAGIAHIAMQRDFIDDPGGTAG